MSTMKSLKLSRILGELSMFASHGYFDTDAFDDGQGATVDPSRHLIEINVLGVHFQFATRSGRCTLSPTWVEMSRAEQVGLLSAIYRILEHYNLASESLYDWLSPPQSQLKVGQI